jgi:hypothetical protein
MEPIVIIIGIICWTILMILVCTPLWMPGLVVLIDHIKGKKKEEYDSFKNSPRL